MKKPKMYNMATTHPEILKFFASKNPLYVLLKIVPILAFFIYLLIGNSINYIKGISFFVFGVLAWSFFEYVVHRWLYHTIFKSKALKWFFETFHLYHHNFMKDYRVLNAGFLLIYPITAFFWCMAYIMTNQIYLATSFSLGMLLYYFFYENVHFLIHYKIYNKGYLKMIQKYHLYHHYCQWNKNYGNTLTIWDKIFGTYDKNYKSFQLSETQKNDLILSNK